MPLLKNGEWVSDDWRFVADDQPLPAATAKLVTLARLQGDDAESLYHCGCRLGVVLASHEPVEALEPWLARLSLVALTFPLMTDGRAFSSAALLRQRYRFTGEIRAVGDVLIDQHAFLRRVGFDAFEVADGRAFASWQRALVALPLAYQDDEPNGSEALSIWRARRGPGHVEPGALQAAE